MKKYTVQWQAEASQIWVGTVEADSEEEAIQIAKQGDVSDEEMVDQHIYVTGFFKIEE